ncbi:MAG TPA: chloride channel protein [Planctomycetota bacterium]|nr:chloride channel protein [Planctomycetota bacterium]
MRRFLRRVAGHEPTVLLVLGLLVGLVTGYGAIICRLGIDAIRTLAFGRTGDIAVLAQHAAPLLVLLLPAIGGLVVAPIVLLFAPEAKGHGVPEVMDAIARHGARIRPRVAISKAIASVVTLGTGGSAGWEGPIIQIGAGFGSSLGQMSRMSRRPMRVLVACGAAAGIAATFNAPIAGVLFALEVLLGDLALVTFSPVVVASVAGAAVTFVHSGSNAVFDIPVGKFRLASAWEIPLYVVLGVASACGAVLFTRLLYFFEDILEGVKMPRLMLPALGGLAVGAIGIAMPEVLGIGYDAISRAFRGEFGLAMLCGLFFAKLAATSLTLGSGGSGGIFAPSLMMGAVLGAGFGEVVGKLFPGVAALPGVYAVVGMAALVAGTTHAPIAAILILFEMTRDFHIIIPLMISCIVATYVARGLLKDSIYTLKLSRRGVRLRGGRDEAVLQSLTVREAMHADAIVLVESMSFGEVRMQALQSRHHVFPVVDAEGRFSGVVTLAALRPFLVEEGLHGVAVARDLAEPPGQVLSPDDDLEVARKAFVRSPYEELPVVDPSTRRVVGLLREHELYAAYNNAVARAY